MGKFVGRLVKAGIAVESTRGLGKAPTYLLPFASLSFDDRVIKARSTGALGKLADSEEAFVATKYGQGDLEMELRSKSIGALLYALLGSLSTSGPTDSAYTHAFSISNDVDTKSLALTIADDNATEMYRMVMLDTLEFNASLDGTVMVTSSFISKQSVSSGASLPALSAESKFTKKGVKVKVASAVGDLAAATVLSIKKLKLTISKGAVVDDSLGTSEPEDVLNTKFSIEGEIDLNYEDETWKNYFRSGAAKAMEIQFVNKDDTIGSSSYPYLKLQFPNVDFFEWSPNYALEDPVIQTVSFKCSYDATNALDIISTCSLVNNVVSY